MSNNVAAVRRFNRFYTRTIGVLEEGFQRSPYSLTEGRLIYELAQADQVATIDLRRKLGLDPGYLSRILARFEADGVVRLGRSAADNRRQVVELSPSGRRAFEMLDTHAKQDMGALLDKLSEADQARLITAMSTIESLWGEPREATVRLRPPQAGELGWVVQRQGVLYAQEYGWNDEFEALCGRIVADFVEGRTEGRDAAWIAEADGVPAGSVFCVEKSAQTAQLRLLFVEPWARGAGVGAALVDACLAFARSAGYQEMVLWTNKRLDAARRLYQRAGFELVSDEEGEAFGLPQTFQNWRLDL
jgi:DNA-binding MarR family transcriptional regulator/GNAT superfamily N-acetyltransferase